MKFFAVFVIAYVGGGRLAATTRASDKKCVDEGISVGLPGGKIDPGESLAEAAIRESREEGWEISVKDQVPVSVQKIQGNWVAWLYGENPVMLDDYKEIGRISPVIALEQDLVGFGNKEALIANNKARK